MKKIFRVCFILLLIIPLNIFSKTIWKDRNIYSAGNNLNVGDVLIVNVNDISKLNFSVTLNADNSYNIISNPDMNVTGFLPSISSNRKMTSSDKNNYSEKGNLQIAIASRVTQIRNDGKLNIAGVKEYSMNGRINRFQLSGIVDPELIKGRKVLSGDIADFRLEVRGLLEPGIIDIQHPEPAEKETANATLTETEKQKIIIDYLNRMLRELNR